MMNNKTTQPINNVEKYPTFNKSMKSDYTILIPDMLPWHFEILNYVLLIEGYKTEILNEHGRQVIDEGLKHVHNDTCYPATCVIGQYIHALKSGKYDTSKSAVLITQTGGGCRASNYVPLIRKALKSEFPNVPVISLNFSGLEKDSGIEFNLKMLVKLAYGILYADSIMSIYNQVKPYEKVDGSADAVRDDCIKFIHKLYRENKFKNLKSVHKYLFDKFKSVEIIKREKLKVGIVGEIYVKYSPLGNNGLERFLIKEDCEPVVPSLMDFVLYCCVNNLNDKKIYNNKVKGRLVYNIAYRWLLSKQKKVIKIFKKDKRFNSMHSFEELRGFADKVINQGVKMGEGWLIPAEIVAFAKSNVDNVICAQPFGCLPNHIVGKGVTRSIRELCPNVNIVPIDYDASASKVNQENRIKLMLSTAKIK